MAKESVPPDLTGTLARVDSIFNPTTAGGALDAFTQGIYVKTIIILPESLGTSPTLTVKDKQGSPRTYLNAVAAPATGSPTIIEFGGVLFRNGVELTVAGVNGDVKVQIIGWLKPS